MQTFIVPVVFDEKPMIAPFGGIGTCKCKVAAFEEGRLTKCSDTFASNAGTLTVSCLAEDASCSRYLMDNLTHGADGH